MHTRNEVKDTAIQSNDIQGNILAIKEFFILEGIWCQSFECINDGVLEQGIVYGSQNQLEGLNENGSLVLLDATHCTSNTKMFLFTLYVKDKYNTWLPSAQFFCTNESSLSISTCLNMIKEKCRKWKPHYFIVDDSGAEQLALRQVFHDEIHVFRCTVHSTRTLMRKVGSYRSVYKYMLDAMFAKTKYMCEANVQKAVDACGNIIKKRKYLETYWMRDSHAWGMWSRQGSLALLQNSTTNAIESYHRILKKKTKKSDSLKAACKKIVTVSNPNLFNLVDKCEKI
jgi:hypothetical protein